MYSDNNDLFKAMISAAFASNILAEVKKIDSRALMCGLTKDQRIRREYLECHDSFQTDITDEDMLLLQVDHALDSGDAARFMQLTNELKGIGQTV